MDQGSAMAVCKKRRIEAEGDVADMNLPMLLRFDCRLTAECL